LKMFGLGGYGDEGGYVHVCVYVRIQSVYQTRLAFASSS
jgi:hypothetical protein